MKENVILVLLILSSISYTIFSQTDTVNEEKSNSGIIYGEDHAYALTAPKGWVLDSKSAVSQGLFAVFYPKSSSWKNGVTVMYTNSASKKVKGNETIEEVIEYDVSNFKSQSKNIVITDSDSLPTKDKKWARVKYFMDYESGNYESVGYIDENKVVVFIIMTSRNEKEFKNSIDKFKELVSSYFLISNDVIIDEHK